jgi:arsenite-transporting ATPase
MEMPAKFVFFGGKGGVGKTTCAAAWAVKEAAAGRSVLLVSTDPAHSLGDALDVRLSSRGTDVRIGRRSLRAVELDGSQAFARWLGRNRRALGDILEHGTWLDRDDIESLLQLTLPGIDELVGILEIVRISDASDERRSSRTPSRQYDRVVIDTAPTGHMLRLLAAPETVAAAATALEALQHEHRLIREQFAHVGRPQAADRLVAALAAQADRTGARLRDKARTEFRWVLVPELLSVAESEDGLRALAMADIHLSEVIVNRVLPDGPPCRVCDPRRRSERAVIRVLPRRLGVPSTWRIVLAETREPRGQQALFRIASQLSTMPLAYHRAAPRGRSRAVPAAPRRVSSLPATGRAAPEMVPAFRGARLLLFGGKGGVGKTTVAAASALRLAQANQARRILLISTDPAHSLSDVLDAVVGDETTTVGRAPQNLHVRELDAAATFAARRTNLEAAVNEIAATFATGALTVSHGGGVAGLMDLAPPGIDELFGILEVADALLAADHGRDSSASRTPRGGPGRGKVPANYDLVIVDTAPTGHALRLLEMPDTARDWVHALLRVLLKYRQLVRPGELAAELVDLSKSIRLLRALLHDSRDTRFVVVTRAAAMPRLETQRLLARLGKMKFTIPAVVVNAMTLAPGRCGWCHAIAAAERRELARLKRGCRRRSRECAIILTPLVALPPRGYKALTRWAAEWTLELH